MLSMLLGVCPYLDLSSCATLSLAFFEGDLFAAAMSALFDRECCSDYYL